MATVYVESDSYLDEVTYASGDSLCIRYGATLTIRESNVVPIGKIYGIDGKIIIDSTLATATPPIVVSFTLGNSYGLFISNELTLSIKGGWHSLGTGDGTSNQTFSFYDSGIGDVPWVQVETGNGTDEWIDCKCLLSSSLATYAGSGSTLGSFFNYNRATQTITFGDGINGIVVPSGARVRCPDIFITGIGSNVSFASRTVVNSTYVGNWNFENVIFSHTIHLYINRTLYPVLKNVGVFGYVVAQDCIGIDIDTLIVAPEAMGTSTLGIYISNCQENSIDNLHACSYSDDALRILNSTGNVGAISGYQLSRDSSGDYSVELNTCSGMTFSEVISIGGALQIYTSSGVTIESLKHSDTPTGVKTVSVPSNCIALYYTSTIRINSVTLVGSPCYNQFISCTGNPKDTIISNIDYDGDNHTYSLKTGAAQSLILARGSFGSIRGSVASNTINDTDSKFMDLLVTSSLGNNSFAGRNCRHEGVACSGNSTAWSGSFDIPWLLLYDQGATINSGSIIVTLNKDFDKNSITLLGNAIHNNVAEVYMPDVDDGLIVEIPDLIIGVPSFQNSNPVLSGAYQTYFTTEYSIKLPGGEWGSWTLATGANLSSETFSATTGFYLKVRFKNTQYASKAKLIQAVFSVNVDSTAKREYNPLIVDISVSGMVSGSNFVIYDTNDHSALFGPITIGEDGSFSSTYTHTSDKSITVVVRKGTGETKYLPYSAPGLITENGFALIVNQVEDTIAGLV